MRHIGRAAVILSFGIAVAGLAGLGAGLPGSASQGEDSSAPTKALPKDGVIRLSPAACEAAGIRVAKAELRDCSVILKAAGKILAPRPRTAIVSYFLPGRIAEVRVGVGDRVTKGQPLLTLECAEAANAMSEFCKAAAAHELAQLTLVREEQLAADGIGARKNLVAAETEAKVGQANLEAAEKLLHVLGFNEEQVKEIAERHRISPAMTLHAPIDGKVVASEAVVGAMVDQSKAILTIVDPGRLWVDAEVYEKDVGKVKLGQDVEALTPAFPAERFSGKVGYIADLVHEETRTITVRAEIENPQERLKPGMFADVSLVCGRSGPVPTVPVGAILEEGTQKIVFVRCDDGFVRREIETGASQGQYRQIITGVGAGEEVVVEGNHQLKSKLSEEVLHGAHVH